MKLNQDSIGKIFEIEEILSGVPCLNCTPCIKLRLMEIGLDAGEKIQVENHQHGLWLLSILSKNGSITSKIALRDEEMERVCVL